MLSLVQIDPSKKTASSPEKGGMDVKDQQPDNTIDEPMDMTGNNDDGLEPWNFFDGDMQVDDDGTWQFIRP